MRGVHSIPSVKHMNRLMGFSNTSEHWVCIWMNIPELHGIKSLREIQKTKPKLIAIEPKLIAIPLF